MAKSTPRRVQHSVIGIVAAIFLEAGLSLPVYAQEVHRFDIDTTDAFVSIHEFGTQSGVQILASADALKGKQLNKISGSLSTDDGFQKLLAGTGLSHRYVGERTVALVADGEADGNKTTNLRDGVNVAQTTDDWSGSQLLAANQESTTDAADASLEEIVVVSERRRNEQRAAKRDSIQVVDAIGRTAIEENAIRSVADLIRQMPGVGSGGASDHGDACCQTIRGLGYIQTTLDGRDITTAGGRNIEPNYIAADIVDAIEIFKTPSADMVEGGMSGLINMKTREPLSYDKFHLAGMLTATYDSGMKKTRPGGDIILGDVWDTSIGKIGVIVGFTGIKNTFQAAGPDADYQSSNRHFDLNGNGVVGDAADTAIVPTSMGVGYQQDGHRERYSDYLRVQWKPNDALELHGSYMGFQFKDSHYQYINAVNFAADNDPANISKFSLVPGTNVVSYGVYSLSSALTGSLAGLHRNEIRQFELGGKWDGGALRMSADVDFTPAVFRTHTGIPIFAANVAENNFQAFITPTSIDGAFGDVNPANPAQYDYNAIIESWARYDSDKYTGRFDVAYDLSSGPFKTLQAGVRLAKLDIEQAGGDRFVGAAAGTPATSLTDYLGLNTGYESRTSSWFVYDPYRVGNWSELHSALGLVGDPPGNPANDFDFKEKTTALYLRGLYEFTLGGKVIDGDVGVRGIKTEVDANGFTIQADGSLAPNLQRGEYTDYLPSFNMRVHLTDTLALRFSGSKTLTRPSFGDLSPRITISATGGSDASGGNPDLQAFNSTGGDATLEWYHSDAGFMFAALFYKKLDGFIELASRREIIGGIELDIDRPVNAGKGSVKGIEVGMNERFVFLPGIWSGMGIDLNATYVDGQLTSSTDADTPLSGAPEYAANAGLYFEYKKFSTRVNINWRDGDSYISYDAGQQKLRSWGTGISIIDASLRYRLNPHIELMANLGNITEAAYPVYWTTPAYGKLRATSYRDFIRIEAGFRAKF